MKICIKCGINKPEEAFTKRKISADGLHPRCRECKNSAEVSRRAPIRGEYNAKERERYRANPESYLAKEKRRMADPVKAAQKAASAKAWLAANSEKIAEYSARHRAKHIEKRRAAARTRYWRDPELSRQKMLEGQKKNRAAFTAREVLRYATKLNATPPWLTEDHKTFMQITYAMANELSKLYGIKFHVDHIHPLQGDGVCGLHVPWNLRVLPAFENQSKGNRLRAA